MYRRGEDKFLEPRLQASPFIRLMESGSDCTDESRSVAAWAQDSSSSGRGARTA